MNKYFKSIILVLLLSIAMLFVGCDNNTNNTKEPDNTVDSGVNPGGDPEGDPNGSTDDPVDPPEPTYTLSFKEESISIATGERAFLELNTNITDEDAIVFRNSDNKVAAFQADGSIKGLKAGEATITATYKELTATIKIIVTEEIKVYEKTDYRYWTNLLKLKYDVEEPLMTQAQINAFNEAVYSDYSKSKVYDLKKLPLTVSGQTVKNLINNYSNMNSYPVYKDSSTQATTEEKNAVLENRNLSVLGTKDIEASYGIIVNFATMRSYPTLYISVKNGQFQYDRFQETGLTVGEAVIIYHYSADKEWCFVQAENYIGWIQSENVAKCTADEFNQYYRSDKYMLCIAERMEIDGTVLRMGDKVPYKSLDDKGFVALMPKRCNDETLCITETLVPNDEKVNDGFMTYNYTNLYELGFKLLGTAYRWGDYMIDGRDCSSTQNAIYHCFGFVMPRNTSNQNKIPGYSTTVSGLNDTTMRTYPIGTLIFTSSHVMMYIGEDETGASYLLHNSGSCKLQTLSSYGGSGMIATLTIRPKN